MSAAASGALSLERQNARRSRIDTMENGAKKGREERVKEFRTYAQRKNPKHFHSHQCASADSG